MTELTPEIQSWKAEGRFGRFDDVEVFYRTLREGEAALPWRVCFHGFPTSSWDWHLLLPALQKDHRVLIFDFPGYGLSGKPLHRDYSLKRQLDAAEALMHSLGVVDFDLLAHDMGNSVACELLRRREQGGYPFELKSLTLLNGGIYMEMHQPLLTQRLLRTPVLGALFARLSSWRMFRLQYPNVYAHPEQFSEMHYRNQWALMMNNDGRRVLHKIAGYMHERTRMGDQWTGPLHRLELPLKVIWGKEDPIAVRDIAMKLSLHSHSARLVMLKDVGHYPQLEAPDQVAAAISA